MEFIQTLFDKKLYNLHIIKLFCYAYMDVGYFLPFYSGGVKIFNKVFKTWRNRYMK